MPAFDTLPILDTEFKTSSFANVIGLVGRTQAGKTTLAQNMATNMMIVGHPVLYLYFERGDKQSKVFQRMDTIRSAFAASREGIPSANLIKNLPLLRVVDSREIREDYVRREHNMSKQERGGEKGSVEGEVARTAHAQRVFQEVITSYFDDLVKDINEARGSKGNVSDLLSPVIIVDSLHYFPKFGSRDRRLQIDDITEMIVETQKLQIPELSTGNMTIMVVLHTSRENGKKMGRYFRGWLNNEPVRNERGFNMGGEPPTPGDLGEEGRETGKESGGLEYGCDVLLYIAKIRSSGNNDWIGTKTFAICCKSAREQDFGRIQELDLYPESGLMKADDGKVWETESKYTDPLKKKVSDSAAQFKFENRDLMREK